MDQKHRTSTLYSSSTAVSTPTHTHSPMSAVSKAFQVNDDAVKHLLRQVVYMFYPHQSIIIMEAILFHNVLFEDDLIKLCCMHKKVFRSFCNKLMEDKLIVAHTQKEETQPYKLFTRTYYYVHSIEAIDSIKWKIHTIVKHVKEEIGNFSEPQGYICPTCHHKYTLLDAASLLTDDKLNFECSICADYLIDDDISQEQKKGQEKLERLMSLVEPIIKYLKIVDDLKIEDNNFDTTLIKYVPAFSDSLALYSVSTRTSTRRKKLENNNANLSDASKRSQATIHVSITADDEDLKRERQKREDRNRKLRQNALPSWHQESTVGKAALGRLDLEEEEDEDADLIQQQDQENPAQPDNADGTTTTSANTANTIQDNSTLINSTDGANGSVKVENAEQAPASSTPSVKTEQPATSGTESTLQTPAKAGQPAAPSNTAPIATIQLKEESIPGSSTKPSSASTLMSTNSAKTTVPASASEGTTAEELDALSAYYSQLRQRQAAEEEEEEEEDEEEEEEDNADNMDIDVIDEEDVDSLDTFNDEAENGTGEAEKSTQTTSTTEDKPTADEAINKDDLDEDDFDLDMFASDED